MEYSRRHFLGKAVTGLGAMLLHPRFAGAMPVYGNIERIVPQLPPPEQKLRLLIDTDAATEIDDVYAIALALASSERFAIEGFVATHWAAHSGPDSIDKSYVQLLELLEVAGVAGKYPVKKGGHPMQYRNTPSKSEGADLIIERAFHGSEDSPLWVVGLGAATNLASALLIEPSISRRVRYVFHSRSHMTWPERSVQWNVQNDILAVRALLQSKAPLVWFDTGTYLTRPIAETEKYVAPSGRLGKYLHEFRFRHPGYLKDDKGFFDVGDFVWLMKPEFCRSEIVKAPTMDQMMYFDHENTNGEMVRVYDIDRERSWKLFDDQLAQYARSTEQQSKKTNLKNEDERKSNHDW